MKRLVRDTHHRDSEESREAVRDRNIFPHVLQPSWPNHFFFTKPVVVGHQIEPPIPPARSTDVRLLGIAGMKPLSTDTGSCSVRIAHAIIEKT
jgi:hypothetical protein